MIPNCKSICALPAAWRLLVGCVYIQAAMVGSSSSSSDTQQPISAQEQERRSMDAAMEAWLVRRHVHVHVHGHVHALERPGSPCTVLALVQQQQSGCSIRHSTRCMTQQQSGVVVSQWQFSTLGSVQYGLQFPQCMTLQQPIGSPAEAQPGVKDTQHAGSQH